jgi:hypothetical protein
MMKLLRSPRTRTTLRRRTHAFARTATVRVLPDLHGALAIAIGSRIGVVAQTAIFNRRDAIAMTTAVWS